VNTGEPTARHEAGHAVVAHLLGGRVRLVTLESEIESHGGHTEVAWSPGLGERDRLDRSAQVALGGPLAELIWSGQDVLDDPAVVSTWAEDWEEVMLAAQRIEGDREKAEARIHRWIHDVRDLLEDPAVDEYVARVAVALEAHETLDETLFEDCFE